LTLSDDVAGSYDLSLFVDQGNLALGSQKGGATKLNSMTISDASPSPLVGTNSTTEGISVINLLDLYILGDARGCSCFGFPRILVDSHGFPLISLDFLLVTDIMPLPINLFVAI
jgi:hypothetical protein